MTPKVVILCGGAGTRLREETEHKPKPLVEICGKPILWHIMKSYSVHGFNDFILCLGYKGNMIKEYFLNYEAFGADVTLDLVSGSKLLHRKEPIENWRITFVDTGLNTNTGGRIKMVEHFIKEPYFLATYGDGVSDVNIKELERVFLEKGKKVLLTGLHPWSKYGQVVVDEKGTVIEFREKPRLQDLINGGYFVFSKDVFNYLDGDPVLEREPFESLAEEGQIHLYKHEGFWHAMDTYKDFQDLNAYTYENMPWRTW